MTQEEYRELNSWLSEGHTSNSNPWNIADETGNELDFVSAMRIVGELAAEHMESQL